MRPIPPLTPRGERLVADYLKLSYRLAADAMTRRGIARDHYEADDVYSLANWCLFECAAQWDGRKCFPDYLAERFRYQLMDEAKAKRFRLVPTEGVDPRTVPEGGDDWLDGPAAVEAFEARIGPLTPAQRNVLRLVFVEGLTPADAAERLGSTLQRVHGRKSDAFVRLRGGTPPGRRP